MKIIVKNPVEIIKDFYQRSSHYWQDQKEDYCLSLFHKMAKSVPAYKKFLKLNSIKAEAIKTFSDYENLPFINKKNYFYKFPLTETVWTDLYQKQGLVMTSTSGSTGHPTYFPRNEQLDWQYSVIAEFFLKNGPKGHTLLIDCFGMGVWIGGLITYQAFRMCALRDFPVTIITPGINKKEIFHALRRLAPNFKNVILSGYPPFLKDVLEECKNEKINLKNLNLRLLFAAESFTEGFRDSIAKTANIKNIYTDTLNIYGSAELGAMAFETPGSIFIRRLALQYPAVYNQLFSPHKVPTLAQFIPSFVSFEEKNREILITGSGASPFVKYRIGDNGGIYSLDQIKRIFSSSGINLEKEAKKSKVQLPKLPFVYVYERSDFSTTLYGLQIYPQTIKKALEEKRLEKSLTGKFMAETGYDGKGNQFLIVNIELRNNAKENSQIYRLCEKSIIKTLKEDNSEYRELSAMLGERRVRPHLKFWPYNDRQHFPSGVKQQWVKK